MEKSPIEMDLEEWELLTHDNFRELGHEAGKSLFPRESGLGPNVVVDVNYFICPSHPPHLLIGSMEDSIPASRNNKPRAHVPARSRPIVERNMHEEEFFVKDVEEIEVASPPVASEENQDVISQVFFKKLRVRETEFADMKMDSPKSPTTGMSVKPQLIEMAGPIQYEKVEEEAYEGEGPEEGKKGYMSGSPPENIKEEKKGCREGFSFTIWRWRLKGGIGALCSMGVAAATICVFILGGRQRQKHQQQQNQKLQFQIYADEKSIKKVVQHATRLNQVISGVRGAPMTQAHISFGGYYDTL